MDHQIDERKFKRKKITKKLNEGKKTKTKEDIMHLIGDDGQVGGTDISRAGEKIHIDLLFQNRCHEFMIPGTCGFVECCRANLRIEGRNDKEKKNKQQQKQQRKRGKMGNQRRRRWQ